MKIASLNGLLGNENEKRGNDQGSDK